MGYKLKPNKAILSRFKVTKRGKLKRHHAKTSHLMSGRNSKTKRRLGRPAILHEGLARNLRKHIGMGHKHPLREEQEKATALLHKENPQQTTAQ
ncbi:MAG TPA: bL35 family ribosomal protein [Tepidisphaeraceae bacterium]|jgi:large subunit ribosomal protein L35|nr:bL35 family ribosomal protein [Tepidisphaeraceae bacterium]